MNLNIFQWRSITTRVTLLTLTFFLFSVWVLTFYISRVLREDLQRVLGAQQFSTTSYVASEVNNELSDRLNTLNAIAKQISPTVLDNTVDLQTFIEQRISLPLLFNGSAWVSRQDGIAIASLMPELIGTNYADREYLITVLKEGKSAISKPITGKVKKDAIFVMAVPIRDAQGQVTGALAGVTDLGRPNFLDKVTESRYGKTGHYFIVDPQHRMVITSTDKSRVMQPLPAPGVNQLIDRFVQGFEGSSVLVNAVGKEVLSSSKLIPLTGWAISISLPTEEAFAPIHDMEQRALIISITLTFLAGCLIWFVISRTLQRQLLPMLLASRTLATMCDSDQPPQLLPVTSQDEIGELIGGFNRLLERLGKREQTLIKSEEELKKTQHINQIGSWYLDVATNQVVWTEELYKMYGFDPLLPPPPYSEHQKLFTTESWEKLSSALAKTKEAGIPYELELETVRKDGHNGWMWVRGETVLDEGGEIVGLWGPAQDITERKHLEKVQVFLAETSSGTTTEPFFYALARFLAENLTMDFVCIDRLEGDGLTARTVAVWHDGHFEDNVSYALKDTPCGEVAGQSICCFTASVCQLFPKDQVLQDLRAESYAGVTLFSHTGQPIGLIAIISRKPLDDRRLVEDTLKMVAVRAAGEMERLDAEVALKTSEKLLRDIAINIPGALYQFVRNPDGSFAVPYMSEGGPQVLGQPLEVLQDASRLFTNVHPDDLPGLYVSISESAETMREWRQEFRILLADGEFRWLLGISQSNRLDNGGICWNGVLLDISKRKQAEAELARVTELLELTGKMAKVGGWELDLVANKMIFSRTARLINDLGPDEEMSLAQAFAMIHPDDRATHQATVESALSSGVSWDRELRMTTTKGRPIWVRIQGVPVMENGRAIKLYGTFRDITERKQAEIALQAALAEKEVLLREVHHRVKNNMAAIIGLFDLQQQTIDDPQAKTGLQELSSRVKAMSLVHEKLYHSESLSRIDFQDYIESLVLHLRSSFYSDGVHYEIAAQGVEVPLDLAVPCGMIINELIVNAFKYAFPKERSKPNQELDRIQVSMSHANDTFSLSVADNGVGLPSGFDLNTVETLGLTLVKMLGEHQLGGRYAIDLTCGTRFTLTFSLRKGSKPDE